MQYGKLKLRGIADCNVHNKNNNSFLSCKRKSHYFMPILAIVCTHFTGNAEIFKTIVHRYNSISEGSKGVISSFDSSCSHISFLEQKIKV